MEHSSIDHGDGDIPGHTDRNDRVEFLYSLAKQGTDKNWKCIINAWNEDSMLATNCARFIKPSSQWGFIHQAAHSGHEEACRILIKLGADTNKYTNKGERPVDIATRRHHASLQRLLSPSHDYQILIGQCTLEEADNYLSKLKKGKEQPGPRLAALLNESLLQSLTAIQLLQLLVDTKEIHNQTDKNLHLLRSKWNDKELRLLGKVSLVANVEAFHDQYLQDKAHEATTTSATLAFVSGLLLMDQDGEYLCDHGEVISTGNDTIDPELFSAEFEKRLLPVLRFISEESSSECDGSFIVIPGIGCRHYAGLFRGRIGMLLQYALQSTLRRNAIDLSNIRIINYDPEIECNNQRSWIRGILLQTRPSEANHLNPLSWLAPPKLYEISGDDFGSCSLAAIAEWDPASWPGDGYYVGMEYSSTESRIVAQTDFMTSLTQVEGRHSKHSNCYLPPKPFENWSEVVEIRSRVHGCKLSDPASWTRPSTYDPEILDPCDSDKIRNENINSKKRALPSQRQIITAATCLASHKLCSSSILSTLSRLNFFFWGGYIEWFERYTDWIKKNALEDLPDASAGKIFIERSSLAGICFYLTWVQRCDYWSSFNDAFDHFIQNGMPMRVSTRLMQLLALSSK